MLYAVCFADLVFRAEFDWLADPGYPIKKCGNDGAKMRKCGNGYLLMSKPKAVVIAVVPTEECLLVTE